MGRRGLAIGFLACGLAVFGFAASRMKADPLRAAAAMAVAVAGVLINMYVLGGGGITRGDGSAPAARTVRPERLVRLGVLVSTVLLIAVGGMWLYLDRVVGPELEARRQRVSRIGEGAGGELTANIERVAAARTGLMWLALAVGVCCVSVAQLIGPKRKPSDGEAGGLR